MTKAELIQALKGFPDDMEIVMTVNGGMNPLSLIRPYHEEYYSSYSVDEDDELIDRDVILFDDDCKNNR